MEELRVFDEFMSHLSMVVSHAYLKKVKIFM